ncbi:MULTISPECIES: low-complexity tail membrane protein [Cyanophyceae]|uniref:Low-complexity tail membrane protein n=1 Tax=Leptolyngbya subtilissima DQ-A4 TaxID=2933933 RepID=A0ABV0K5A5_9CYAN|nr:low-complexity tail membrane protein [Nodosilinea sp. FACHB-141]MBD2112897.1 low-complexity tail membrane protein [Nodosilinea sp. FACHB-141]
MAPWRCDPYLWVHLAGLATVPLWIDLCLLGLAVGNPVLPGLELGVIVALGVLPVLVMQLRQPFYIFSLPGLALKPSALQDNQRRLLSQFRRWRVRLGALLVPVPLVWGLLKLYPLAFLARDLTPFSDWGRLGGVAIAALSFFMANLFLQIPIAVLQVLATPDRVMTKVAPYSIENVAADFTWIGLTVGKILPDLITRPKPESATSVMVETFEPPQVVPVGVLDEPEGGVAEAIVETEVPLEHAVEAGATDELAAHIRASNLSASSEAIARAVDLENPEDSVAADSFVDSDATSGYKPLRHPEVEESSDDTAHLDDAAYPQSLPAIADVYPNSR